MHVRVILLIASLVLLTSCGPENPEVITGAPNMSIASSAFTNNGPIPTYYTCYGSNARIPFEIKDVPERTKSLVVFFDDPDTPGKAWHHWLMWDVAPTKKVFSSTEQFTFPEGTNSNKTIGYLPPCPAPGTGTHRYILTVYALDTTLSLPTETTYEEILPALRNHILDRVTLIGTYEKNF